MPRIYILQRREDALALEDVSARRPAEIGATLAANAYGRAGATQVNVLEVFQVETPPVLGSLASVLNVITQTGLVLEHLSTVRSDQNRTLWEITAEIDESAHAELLGRLNALPSVRFVGWSNRVFDRIIGAAHRSVPTDAQRARAEEPPEVNDPQSEAP